MNRARTTIALALLAFVAPASRARPDEPKGLFDRSNLVAWCIVPFDSRHRGPEDRAALLDRLGLKRLAYDWRAEHVPTFDAELETLARHKIALSAFWVAPGELNRESRRVLDVLKRHQVNTELWVLLDMGAETKVDAAEQVRRVESAASKLGPLAAEAGAQGCSLALYNHGGWFGEPENQLAIIEHMKARKIENVGIVYNLHHGHAHLDRLAGLLKATMPYLRAVNLNGMDADGEAIGRKILPLGQGARDLEVLRTIRDSGYRGPIGILGHTMDDAEERLRDNLDGLDWLVAQLDGQPPGPRPKPRTPVAPRPDADKTAAAELARDALSAGDARRGADVFSSPKYACLSCHKVGDQGGNLGPSLDEIGHCDDAAAHEQSADHDGPHHECRRRREPEGVHRPVLGIGYPAGVPQDLRRQPEVGDSAEEQGDAERPAERAEQLGTTDPGEQDEGQRLQEGCGQPTTHHHRECLQHAARPVTVPSVQGTWRTTGTSSELRGGEHGQDPHAGSRGWPIATRSSSLWTATLMSALQDAPTVRATAVGRALSQEG